MKRFRDLIFGLLLLTLAATPASAQQKPPVTMGGQATQLRAGTTLAVQPSATGAVSLDMPQGAAPASPASGDCWTTAAGFFCKINGTIINHVRPFTVASILDYGADPTGAADSTAAIQAALNSGKTSVYIPAGVFKACGLLMPSTKYLTVNGTGTSSRLIQGNCGKPLFYWSNASMAYNHQVISDLTIDGASGNSNSIDTTGAGGVALRSIYFNNIPASYSSIYINGLSSDVTHDVQVINMTFGVQSGGPHSKAMIEVGPYTADSRIQDSTGNGNFIADYAIYLNAGATAISLSNNHLYNTKVNVVRALGCKYCQWNGNTWDNSLDDIMRLTVTHNVFTGEYFESTRPDKNAATLVDAQDNSFLNTIFGYTSLGTAKYIISETGNSLANSFIGGSLSSKSGWTSPIASFLSSSRSFARNIPGYSNLGLVWSFNGASQSAQSQNTTMFLGTNGIQSSANATAYGPAVPGASVHVVINVDKTPAAGQTFTETAYNGTTSLGSCTISSGAYGCTITTSNPFAVGDSLYIKSVFSATSGSANIRYSWLMQG